MKFILIKEDLQRAKKILREKNIPEDNTNFKKLKRLLEKNMGLLGLFTFFMFNRKVSYDKLVSLLDRLKSSKTLLGKLPKELVKYDDIEELEDDLDILEEWKVYNNEFVSKLISKFKKGAREDDELKNNFIQLDDERKSDLFSNFFKKMSRYKTYKEFRTDTLKYMNRNTNIEGVLKMIKETPNVYLVYNNDNIVIVEVYSRKSSCKLGSKSWCISGNSGSYWDTYAGPASGNKQYFLWNFNVPVHDNDSQLGITINKNGNQKTAHLKDDSYTNYISYFEKYNIPYLLSPLVKEDVDKLVKSYGFTKDIIKIINYYDLFDNYKTEIPVMYKISNGLVISDNELTGYDETDRLLFGEYNDFLYSVVNFCNKWGDYNGVIYDNKNYTESDQKKFIDSLDFNRKCIFYTKYESKFESYGIDILFDNEITDVNNPIEISTSYNTIQFDIKLKEDEYYDYLGIDYDYYYNLEYLGNNDIFYGSEEDEYLYNYISDEVRVSLEKYISLIFGGIEEFNDINLRKYEDNFTKFMDLISFFDDDDIRRTFEKFYEDLISEADNLQNDDYKKYRDALVGDYNYNSRTRSYELSISIEDVLKLIPNSGLDKKSNMLEWLESSPNNINDVSFSFYDVPYAGHYLGMVDSTELNKDLNEYLEEVIESEETKEKATNFRIIVSYLKKSNFVYKEIKQNWRKSWSGYINGKNIISLNSIDLDNLTADVMYLKNDISSYYSLENSSKDWWRDNNKENIIIREIDLKKVIEGGISIVELKFEKIKSFLEFSKTK